MEIQAIIEIGNVAADKHVRTLLPHTSAHGGSKGRNVVLIVKDVALMRSMSVREYDASTIGWAVLLNTVGYRQTQRQVLYRVEWLNKGTSTKIERAAFR